MSIASLRRHLLLVAGLCLAASPVAGQGPPPAEGPQWSLGLGVISSPRPYVEADNSTRVIPLIDFESERFYFRGIQAGFRAIEEERFGLDLIARAQFGGYDESDSSFLEGMAERQRTLEVGLAASWDLGRFDLQATAVADALGRSDGVQAGLDLTWKKIIGRGKAGIFPSLGFVWQDSNFVDYYAGVERGEARRGRPAFEAGSALNLGLGLRGFVTVGERARLIALMRVERLDTSYEESPILASRWGTFGLLAIAWEL